MTAIGLPSFGTPVSRSFLMSAALHVPMPVSLSGLIFGAVTSNAPGTLKRSPPEKSLPATAAGGPFGEWQLPQVMMVLTRYEPRSSGVSAYAVLPMTEASATSVASDFIITPKPRCRPEGIAGRWNCQTKSGGAHNRFAAAKGGNAEDDTPSPAGGNCAVLRRRCFGLGRASPDRPGVLALGLDVAVNKLDHRDRGGIAVAETGLHHPDIATLAVLVARPDHLKQLLDHGQVAHLRDRLAARVQVAAFA